MKALFASFALCVLVCSSGAYATETPEALKALLRNPTLNVANTPEGIYRGKAIQDILAVELLGTNRVFSDCEPAAGSSFSCTVTVSRLPSAAGALSFSFQAKQSSTGAMLIRSPIEVSGN